MTRATAITRPAETGVVYAPGDLAGLGRRVFVVLIDLTVVFFLCVPIVAVGGEGLIARVGVLLVAWAYFGWLKVTSFRTFGYQIADVELVDLHGDRASVWRSTLRFLFLFFTLGNGVDLLLLSHDPVRQALHDKLVGTYVIRRGAHPIGSGPVSYSEYFIGGLSIVLPEVDSADVSPAKGLEDHTDS